MDDGWRNVGKQDRCPVCKKDHGCTIGKLVVKCRRVESNRQCPDGCWLHPIPSMIISSPVIIPPRKKSVPDAVLAEKFTPIALHAHHAGKSRLPQLAAQLWVATSALEALCVGWAEIDSRWAWTFPERNAKGEITGISLRLETPLQNGKGKLCAKGSRRALVYTPGWWLGDGIVALVEGASDVAAAYTLGVSAIGRPSNIGGIAMLAAILKRHAPKRRIVVIGENDRKSELHLQQLTPPHDPKCRACPRCHPGRYGAEQTARKLQERLHRHISVIYPPLPYKDLRSFLNAQNLDLADTVACRLAGESLRQGGFPQPH